MHIMSTGEKFLCLPFVDEVFGILSHGHRIGRHSEFERQAIARFETRLQLHGACSQVFDFLKEEATAVKVSSDTTDLAMDEGI